MRKYLDKLFELLLIVIVAVLIMAVNFFMCWIFFLILGKGLSDWNIYVFAVVIALGIYSTYEFFKGMDKIN